MKKLLLLFLLVSFANTTKVKSEIIQNSGFESWIDGKPNHWTTTSSAGNATLVQSMDAHSGSYSVQVNGETKNVRLGYEETNVEAGTYIVTFYAKALGGDAVTSQYGPQVSPGYATFNADGTINSNGYKYGVYATLPVGEWTLVTDTLKIDAAQQVCFVVMNAKNSGNILIDDYSIAFTASIDSAPDGTNDPQPTDTTTVTDPVDPNPDDGVVSDQPIDYSYFKNGDFEAWHDGMPDHWKSSTTASSASLIRNSDSHGGAYSVLIEGALSNKRLAYKELVLAAGTYTFSLYAKGEDGNETAEVRLGYVPWKADGSLGSYVYGDYVKTPSEGGWVLVSYVFSLTETTKLNMVVMNPKNAGNLLVDDAKLVLSEITDNNFCVNGIYYKIIDSENHLVEISQCSQSIDKSFLVLPDTVSNEGIVYTPQSIAKFALRNFRDLTTLVVPENIRNISADAIVNCPNLKDIMYLSLVPPESWIAAETTYVPSKERYIDTPHTNFSANYSLIDMATIADSVIYSGAVCNLPWTNNLPSDYTVSLNYNNPKVSVGTYLDSAFVHIAKKQLDVTLTIPYKYEIARKKLTITAESKSRLYGEDNPSFSFTYDGFVANENDSVLIQKPSIHCMADRFSAVGSYVIAVSDAVAENYRFIYKNGALSVDKATLIVRAFDANRTYGEENPEFLLEYVGFKNNDSINHLSIIPTVETTASPTSNVGIYTIAVTGGYATNYKFQYQYGQLCIEKAPLQITANDCSRKYGQENPVFSFTYSGFVNNDNQNCLSIMPTAESNANQLSPVGRYEIAPSGANAMNYEINYGVGYLEILKEMLTVIAYNAQQEYGEETPELKYYITGFANNETEDVLSSKPLMDCEADSSSPAGQYPIVASNADAMNYEFKYVDGVLTITKAPLAVSTIDATRCYGEENPDFALTYSGFKNGETESILATIPYAYTNATETSNVGNYAIYVTGGVSDRYSFNYTGATLTIEKASQEIVWDQEFIDVMLNDQVPLNVYATSGLDISFELSDENLGEIYIFDDNYMLDCKKVGTLTLRAMQNGNGNYKPAMRVIKTIEILDPTGLELVYSRNGLVDVYNAQGAKVKSQVRRNEALDNLPQGIYIIEGRKVLVDKQ